MKDCFADSMSKANWGVYSENYTDIPEKQEGYVVESPLWIDENIIAPLLENAKVEITTEGLQLGIIN